MHDESLAISGEPPAGASRVPTFPCGPHAAGRRALFRNAAILAIAIGLLVFLGGGIGLRGIDLVLLHEHEVPWVGGALVMMALASAFVYSSRSGGSVALEPQAVVFRGLGWRGRNYRIRYADLRSVRVRRAGFLQAVEIRSRGQHLRINTLWIDPESLAALLGALDELGRRDSPEFEG